MRKPDPLGELSFHLGVQIVRLVRKVRAETQEYGLCDQLIRSGTAPGALVCEAAEAESLRDMSHKFGIALKEARETKYWLRLLVHGMEYSEEELSQVFATLNSVTALLVSSRKTLRERIKRK